MMKRTFVILFFALVVLGAGAQKVSEIRAPKVVGVPPSDAYIGLSKLPSGEIRHYNYGEQSDGASYFLQSLDSGLTWRKASLPKGLPFADVQSPKSGEYVRVAFLDGQGLYSIRTSGGLTGGRTMTKITDTPYIMCKPPVFVRGGARVLVATHGIDRKGCGVFYSDDDGVTWSKSQFVNAPPHAGGGLHQGIRWNHGAVEPTVVELLDGRLWMIMRTAQDWHYQSFSEDGGQTWSEPTKSPFYGTITMPLIQRLADGRLVFLWNNTTPLPETGNTTGVWDDVFTNRNVLHAAISEDDGRTWIGLRELYIDPMRNAADFATRAGVDKSVHQTQFVELSPGKLLVSLGQSPHNRKMLIFDVNWLYDSIRTNNFADSLAQWSTFKYYKGIVGHCGYNRTEGGRILPHPTLKGHNVLNLRNIPNDSLLQSNDGALWNFPAARKGRVTASLRMEKASKPAQLLLGDRWFNANDSVAARSAMYVLPLEPLKLSAGTGFHKIVITWNLDSSPAATVTLDGRSAGRIPLENSTIHGISYLQFITSPLPDTHGLTIEEVSAEKL